MLSLCVCVCGKSWIEKNCNIEYQRVVQQFRFFINPMDKSGKLFPDTVVAKYSDHTTHFRNWDMCMIDSRNLYVRT